MARGLWRFAILVLLLLKFVLTAARKAQPVLSSEFERYLAEGRIEQVLVSERQLIGRLKAPESGGRTTFVATRMSPEIADMLAPSAARRARRFRHLIATRPARGDEPARDIRSGAAVRGAFRPAGADRPSR
jgi:hypothetical protein